MTAESLAEVLIHLHPLNASSSPPPPGLHYAHFTTALSAIQASIVNGTNISNDSGFPASKAPPAVVFIKSLAMVAIMFMAVAGNLLVITSVLRFEKLRIIANWFIVSLAFADLLVAILVMPFSASQEIAGRWVFGKVYCDIFNANDVLFSTASLLHLCFISMDRYIAITDPFRYESKMTPRRVAVMLLCAWGASAMISHIPIHLGWYTTEQQKKEMRSAVESCNFVVNKPYAVISSFISFWTPTIVMVFTYMKIFREARRQEKQIYLLTKHQAPSLEHLAANSVRNGGGSTSATTNAAGSATATATGNASGRGNEAKRKANVTRRLTQDRKKMRREHKAAKTLGVIMGAFLCCWLPFFLWYLTSSLCDQCWTPPVLVSILFWIGYLNSAINPIIYAFFNRDFRFAFKRLLRCRQLRRCCCCFFRFRSRCHRHGLEANALAQYPQQPASGKGSEGQGADCEHSSASSPRMKRFYDTVEQPSL